MAMAKACRGYGDGHGDGDGHGAVMAMAGVPGLWRAEVMVCVCVVQAVMFLSCTARR